MFLWPRKDTLLHHWTLLRCENRAFAVFMRNVFLTFDPGSWCSFDPGRTPSSTIGPCFGVKIEISMFLWEMFFWPLTPEVDVPLTPEGHPRPPLDLASVWKSRFRCFYEKCFFDLWPLTWHKQTNRQTNGFSFFRNTLPSVEGIFMLHTV
jgi:hypothetical protein